MLSSIAVLCLPRYRAASRRPRTHSPLDHFDPSDLFGTSSCRDFSEDFPLVMTDPIALGIGWVCAGGSRVVQRRGPMKKRQ
jgi:hypothetical protein